MAELRRRELLLGLLGAATLACNRPREQADTSGPRLVVLGGPLTELVFALGLGDRIVGADTSSYYPPAAASLPKVGYQRKVSAEGVIGLAPTLVLHTDTSGPPAALEQIRAAGIETASFAEPWQLDDARTRVRELAKLLGREAEGAALLATLERELAELERLRAGYQHTPSVMFLYTRGADVLMVAGRETPAATMIEQAGARLAFEHREFMPLSAEAVIAAKPEVILVTARGLGSLGGELGLLEQPGLAETPAGRAKRILAFDDLALLGFGPRTGATLLELSRALHPELA